MTTYVYCIPDSEPSPGPVLAEMLNALRPGDTLQCRYVTDLATNWRDLKKILDGFEAGCRLKVKYSSGKAGEPMEVALRRDLRRAAIARAQARGSYKQCGRKRRVAPEAIRGKKAEGKRPAEIAAELNIGIATVYRALAAA
jgi:DNA invertase Pin-like site-specific DNA recombinase